MIEFTVGLMIGIPFGVMILSLFTANHECDPSYVYAVYTVYSNFEDEEANDADLVGTFRDLEVARIIYADEIRLGRSRELELTDTYNNPTQGIWTTHLYTNENKAIIKIAIERQMVI